MITLGVGWRRAAAGTLVVAVTAVAVAASAGPAAAAGCRNVQAPQTSWDLHWNSAGEGVWRTNRFPTSGCGLAEMHWAGWANTIYDAADLRAVTYRDDGTPITYSSWVRVSGPAVNVIIRRDVAAGRLIEFRARAVRASVQTGMHPPDPDGTSCIY